MHSTAARTQGKLFYGWIQVAACWLVYFFISAPIQYGILSILIPNMSLEYNWNSSVVSLANSLSMGGIAVFSTAYGMLANRFRMKHIMVCSTVLGIAAVAVMKFFGANPAVVLFLIILLSVCTTMGALIPTTVIVKNWFVRNRSLPMAAMLSAGGLGGFVSPLIYQSCSSRFGDSGCVALTLAFFTAALLIILFVIKQEPAQIGEIPDGRAWVALHPVPGAENRKSLPEEHVQVRMADILKTSQFYIIGFLNISVKFVLMSVCSYIVLYSLELGITGAAVFVSAYNLSGLAGRLTVAARDRIPVSSKIINIILFILTFTGITLVYLVHTTAGIMTGAILSGFGAGFFISFMPLLVAEYFGEESYTLAYGNMMTIGCAGSFLYPVLVIVFYNVMGTYSCAYLLAVVASGLALLMSFTLRKK